MAVVSISRIQIRRGKANEGTGFPQLASGELGWAIDTQELYIGNGSVAEGAPAVGNTKVLTQKDFDSEGSILNLIQYIYKYGDLTIQTGPAATDPSSRYIQDRLADRVSTADFGTRGNGVDNDTVALQRAINQLYLNTTKASANTPAGVASRVLLEMTPGVYNINSTIYIPSYASLVGAGSDKTIINFTGTGPVFRFVNDTSAAGNPSSINTTTGSNQPRSILLKGLTIATTSATNPGLQLDAVKDSTFDDVKVTGNWGGVYNSNNNGLLLQAFSDLVTCENNIFRDVYISGFSRAVFSKQDILNNYFENCYITDALQGFVLGLGYSGATGEVYGPRETYITKCKFNNVKQQGVYVAWGTNNTVTDCVFKNTGDNGGGYSMAQYPQVYFDVPGNTVINNRSDRNKDLSRSNVTVPYVPEVAGQSVTYTLYGTSQFTIGQISSPALAFRLPVSTAIDGEPESAISYNIDYLYRSTSSNFSRKGTIKIIADIDETIATSAAVISLTDDFDYVGNISEADSIKLNFTVSFLDEAGATYTGSPGQVPYSIAVNYTNTLTADAGFLSYTYTAIL